MSIHQLEKPQCYDSTDDIACYSPEQMQAYGKACRDAALEEAAQVCSHKAETKRLYLNEAHYLECAEAIRSLK